MKMIAEAMAIDEIFWEEYIAGEERCQGGLPGGGRLSLKGLLGTDQDEADRKSIPAPTPPKKNNTQEGVLLTPRNGRRPWGWNLEITREKGWDKVLR